MNFSTSLQLTSKGADEVTRRVYKLSLKKRSVLILLEQAQTIEFILRKTVFPREEIVEEIRALLRDAFIAICGGEPHRPDDKTKPATTSATDGNFLLYPDISLSEAKFLLIDFCVDHFGTQSHAFVEEIRACNSEKSLRICLEKTFAAVDKQLPGRLPELSALVKKINETA
jgi:hypothetical protein